MILFAALVPGEIYAQHKKDIYTPPQFPGGSTALGFFFYARLHKVAGARNKEVFISFVVAKDGALSDFKLIHGLNKQADSEALRVIKLSPKWKPATENGVAYMVTYMLPIVFKK